MRPSVLSTQVMPRVLPTLLFFVCVQAATAQDLHRDIEFKYSQSQITFLNNQSVWEAIFATSGLSRQFTVNPGFASEGDVGLGIGANQQIVYNVLSDLLYWNGTTQAPEPTTSIKINNIPPSVPPTFVSGNSGVMRGAFDPPANRIGTSSGGGDFHSHVSFELLGLGADEEPLIPATGAYALQLSLTTDAPNIDDSDPFLIVFNFGLNATQFALGVSELSKVLAPAAICDLTGDQTVDAADAGIMFANWSGSGVGDCNSDGIVDAADAGVMFGEWTGDSTTPAFATASGPNIPEPMHLGLACVSLAVAMRFPGQKRINR